MKQEVIKPYNNGQWTAARFHSFIKSALRSASVRWPPKYAVKKAAWVRRGVYKCAGYKRKAHEVPASLPPPEGKKKRINNVQVDHKVPIIDPIEGFVSWDEVVRRMFIEAEGLQVLCYECHRRKTQDEKELKKKRK